MKMVVTAWRELIGLFVDDGRLALSIVAVVVIAALLSLVPGAALAAGGVLMFGCLGVLIANVVRASPR
ncbi:MAG TPA: hypothetical protein VKX28_22335 [Xanthobacteraceae bacterium]|nr:hypothetical protein [Xanthobacteraceae bacterium]